jgi:GTP-binding protein HflX
VILSDTVGFISDLPTQLVEAFRATLEEVAAADIILHVRDAAHPDSAAQRSDVLGVLGDMAKGEDAAIDEGWPNRVIEVLNKADLIGGVDAVPEIPGAIAVSALTGDGLDALREALDARMTAGMETADYRIAQGDGAGLAWLYEHGEVLSREDDEDAIRVSVRLTPADRARFEQRGQ